MDHCDIAAIDGQREEDRSVVVSEEGPHLVGICSVVSSSRDYNGRPCAIWYIAA